MNDYDALVEKMRYLNIPQTSGKDKTDSNFSVALNYICFVLVMTLLLLLILVSSFSIVGNMYNAPIAEVSYQNQQAINERG